MKKGTGINVYSKHKILNDFSKDLQKCFNSDVVQLPLDIRVGLHNEEISRGKRTLIGIQTEHLHTASSAPGWMAISKEQLLRNIELCDYIIDFSYRNIEFYQKIDGFDLSKLIAGPYIFPDFLPESSEPTDKRSIFVGTLKGRQSRQESLKKYSNVHSIRIEENMYGSELDAAFRDSSAVINIHNIPSVVTELPRLLKAYLNGNILLSEKLDLPFVSGRHYIELNEASSYEISQETRDKILSNIYNDFSRYKISSILKWIASGAQHIKSLNYLGAYDRYNYGDILMPVLLENYRARYFPSTDRTLKRYFTSLRQSNLTSIGGIPTEPAFEKDGILGKEGSVIVCGGEVIGSTRTVLLSHYADGPQAGDTNIPMWPYMPHPNSAKRVLLNTVGGTIKPQHHDYLANAHYASFRDQRFAGYVSDKPLKRMICPDSVTLMSDLIPIHDLQSRCRPEVIKRIPSRYFTYQAAPEHVKKSPKEISEKLTAISELYDLECVLLPIGYAAGHNDLDHLKTVFESGKKRLHLLDDLNIYEIAYVIGKSDLFTGTSLHGAITSMTYTVPFVPLLDGVRKLKVYVKTWATQPFTTYSTLDHVGHWLSLPKEEQRVGLQKLEKQVQNMKALVNINNYIMFREGLFDY